MTNNDNNNNPTFNSYNEIFTKANSAYMTDGCDDQICVISALSNIISIIITDK